MGVRLSIIIVNYNVSDFLAQCLDTVREAIAHIDAEVIVVDNNSTDDSVAMLAERYPWVISMPQDVNAGFSRANNIGIERSSGEYVLLLNPDTLVAGDTLMRCIAYLDRNEKVGALGARMFDARGHFALESRRGLPTPFTSFCKMSGLIKLFPKSRTVGRYYMQYLDERQPHEIEVMSGAFMMVRRRVLDEVGLLDERFFMHCEDIDISYRITLGGWQNHYVPYPLIHYKGESTRKCSFNAVHVFYNAMLMFYNKHFAHQHSILTWLIKLAVLSRAAFDLVERKVWAMLGDWAPKPKVNKKFILTRAQLTERIATGDALEDLMEELRERTEELLVIEDEQPSTV